ncbi:MAG: diadenosine tetraphosphate (Ap4A) HIT family hydrolase [Oleiphilaceae bacterium]
MFKLDARLDNDTINIASWPLCEVQLMNESQFPWVILIPRIEGATELYHLDKAQREQLDTESIFLSEALMAIYQGDKLNTAALGNVVSQLHIHHVVRFDGDITWPAPVWGKVPAKHFSAEALATQKKRLAVIIAHSW